MITRRTLLIATAASVAGCGDDKQPSVPYPPPAPGQPLQWVIGPVIGGQNHSIGMPPAMAARPDGLYEFIFPTSTGKIDYVYRTALPADDRVMRRMEYRIEGGAAGFTASDGHPTANVRLFIQRRGDNWSGVGPFASYRFWSAPQQLADGDHVLESMLTGWTNVQGQQDEPGLQATIADAEFIGFTFGGWSAGHGVYSNAPGAKFVLVNYK